MSRRIAHIPTQLVRLPGWYEHMDRSWGFYDWEGAGGVSFIALVLTVPTARDTLGPSDAEIRKMARLASATADHDVLAWTSEALQGGARARVECLRIQRTEKTG